MKKNNQGLWEATSPTDLIGWSISSHSALNDNWFVLEVVSRGTKERRTVYATQEALPVYIVERAPGNRKAGQ